MRIEKTVELPADAAAVWEALTNPKLTRQYYFDCEALSDWQVGSPLIFRFDAEGQKTIPVKGVIRAVEPHRFLEHTCFASEFEDVPDKHTTVTYTLSAQGSVTLLSVTQGDFSDEEDLGKHHTSWDHVLGGLKALLRRQSADRETEE